MNVTLEITVPVEMASELRVFLGKAQCGNERAACDHPRAIRFLNSLPKQIDMAAGYQRVVAELNKERA